MDKAAERHKVGGAQLVRLRRNPRQRQMRIGGGAAMTWNVLHHGEHSPFDHAFDYGAAEIDDGGNVMGKRAIADHVMCAFDRQVEHRRAIDIDPKLAKIVGDEPRIEIRGFARDLRSIAMQGAEHGGRRPRFPVRRFETRHASAFLIDQDRCRRIAHAAAQFAHERAHLLAIDNVAAEQDKSPRLRIGIKSTFGRRQKRSRAAIDRTCAHECCLVPRRDYLARKQFPPSAFSLSQSAEADVLSPNDPTRKRYQVPLSPRSTFWMSKS